VSTTPALAACRQIRRLHEVLGRAVAWLTLAMMIVTCIVVVLRYGFGIGSIGLQESVIYLHATVFMLGAAVAVQRGAHVRVDIFYRRFEPRRRALVDLLGALLFLLPLSLFMLVWCWDYVMASWQIREGSADAGGLPAVFLLKTLIPVTAVLLAVQALVEIAMNGLRLAGFDTEPGDRAGESQGV
jgi:TRAP-type mannitol/chloroaromatic compound transport system permease small subunit